MKKVYINPTIVIYKLSPVNIVAESSGTTIDDTPGTADIDVEDSREDNTGNNQSIWDNAW